MIIEVGKTYIVSNAVKKSLYESEMFKDEYGNGVTVTTMWRGGSYKVTPANPDEVAALMAACVGEELVVSDFEDWEMETTWDGCSEDYKFYGDQFDNDTAIQEWEELFEEEGYWTVLDDNNFEPFDCDVVIYNGIEIEEA